MMWLNQRAGFLAVAMGLFALTAQVASCTNSGTGSTNNEAITNTQPDAGAYTPSSGTSVNGAMVTPDSATPSSPGGTRNP